MRKKCKKHKKYKKIELKVWTLLSLLYFYFNAILEDFAQMHTLDTLERLATIEK